MRGRANVPDCSPLGKGITPAYAGKSCCPILRLACTRDHPRVCGEEENVGHTYKKRLGSPPRMRGREKQKNCPLVSVRITPAYAGKRCPAVLRWVDGGDHPRVCGEEATPCTRWNSARGSPPRMRGRVPLPLLPLPGLGITPACAGKSMFSVCTLDIAWDHPRVCGEKQAPPHRLLCGCGSPPRVRGKGVDCCRSVL